MATRAFPRRPLQGIDALVFDVQDVGSRYYTFIYTLFHALEACGRGKRLVVLDRPNPWAARSWRQRAAAGVQSFVGCTRCRCATV